MTELLLCAAALLIAPSARRTVRRPIRCPKMPGAIIRRLAPLLLVPATLFSPALAISAVIVVVTIRRRWRLARAIDRDRRRQLAVAVGLEAMVAELRVGAHQAAACSVAGREIGSRPTLPPETGAVFRRAAAVARLGGTIATAFGDTDCPHLRSIGRIGALTDRHGLEAAHLFEALAADVRRRLRFASRLHSALAGARATAGVLAVLPLAGLGLGQLMGARPAQVLLGTGWGGMAMVVGTGLSCLGLVWSDAIAARAVP